MKGILFFLMFLVGTAGYAERDNEIEEVSGPIRSYEEQLAEYGVGVSKEDLLVALSHPDPEVRSLAAGKLTEDRIEEAIPAIRKLLLADPSWKNQIGFGVLLYWLGDTSGIMALRRSCTKAEPKYLRIQAAHYLLDKGDLTCLDALEEILKGDDTTAKSSALNLIAWRKPVALYRERFGKYFIAALNDDSSYLRRTAISEIDNFGKDFAIPALKKALAMADDWASKIDIAEGLASLGDTSTVAIFKKACTAAAPKHLRARAFHNLAAEDMLLCLDALEEILADEKADITTRNTTLSSLGAHLESTLYRERFGEYFIRALTDSNHNIKKTAIRHIGKLGNDIAIPALEAAAKQDPDEQIRALMLAEIARLKTASPKE